MERLIQEEPRTEGPRMNVRRIAAAVLAGFVGILVPNSSVAEPSTSTVVAAAVSPNAAVAAPAIAALRASGPAGLAALVSEHARDIQRVRAGAAAPKDWERTRHALDTVAAQRDAYASGLYWYTDLDAAKAAAE